MGLAECRRILVQILSHPAGCFTGGKAGNDELSPLPVPGRNTVNQHSAISGGSTHATGDPRTGRKTSGAGNVEENHLDNPAGGPSIKPLPAMGTPGERYWMGIGWIGKLPLDGESVSMVPLRGGIIPPL